MPRRIKTLIVTVEMLARFFQGGFWTQNRITKNALPPDAEILGVELVGDRTVHFLIGSETYPEVADGEPIPEAETITLVRAETPPVAEPFNLFDRYFSNISEDLLRDAMLTPESPGVELIETSSGGTRYYRVSNPV